MIEETPSAALVRADFCRFLAACYYQPAREFAEEDLFGSMVSAAKQVDADLAQHASRLGEHFEREGLDTLLVDYTRLFLGPTNPSAKPYGSFWLTAEKTLMQTSTLAVHELYREAGFELDESFRELPDHIAAELEFLYLLIYREAEARHAANTEQVDRIMNLRRRFLEQHLGIWVKPFTTAVRTGAQSDFYQELGAVTQLFVELELGR
jgi:TorA maturation chaperone TorD